MTVQIKLKIVFHWFWKKKPSLHVTLELFHEWTMAPQTHFFFLFGTPILHIPSTLQPRELTGLTSGPWIVDGCTELPDLAPKSYSDSLWWLSQFDCMLYVPHPVGNSKAQGTEETLGKRGLDHWMTTWSRVPKAPSLLPTCTGYVAGKKETPLCSDPRVA